VQRRYRKFDRKATLTFNLLLLEVSADDLDDIVGGFFRGLGIARHVVADVVFHQFAHEAVDGAARGREALEDIRAGIIFIEGAQDAFELADDLLSTVDEVQFFA